MRPKWSMFPRPISELELICINTAIPVETTVCIMTSPTSALLKSRAVGKALIAKPVCFPVAGKQASGDIHQLRRGSLGVWRAVTGIPAHLKEPLCLLRPNFEAVPPLFHRTSSISKWPVQMCAISLDRLWGFWWQGGTERLWSFSGGAEGPRLLNADQKKEQVHLSRFILRGRTWGRIEFRLYGMQLVFL